MVLRQGGREVEEHGEGSGGVYVEWGSMNAHGTRVFVYQRYSPN